MTSRHRRAAILVSGSGTNLQAFIDRTRSGELGLDIVIVFSNRADAYGLVRARDAGIPAVCVKHGAFVDRERFDRAMARELDDYRPDFLVLAGFMRILSPWFVNHYNGRILNIHPALLPAYPGLDTHQRVLDAGDEWHGSTVHFVTADLDAGPRILQGRTRVRPGETAQALCERIQAIEHQIYPQAAGWIAQGRIEYRDAQVWLDGERLDEPRIRDFD